MGEPVHRTSISLPPKTFGELRDYAEREHGGKVSPAIAEILEYWFLGERIGIDLRTHEGKDIRTGAVTKSGGRPPGAAASAGST